jgi:hypothetical protein
MLIVFNTSRKNLSSFFSHLLIADFGKIFDPLSLHPCRPDSAFFPSVGVLKSIGTKYTNFDFVARSFLKLSLD